MEGISEVQGKRKKTRPLRGTTRRSDCPRRHSHPFEVRRKAVQLYLEEGFSPELIARQMGVGGSKSRFGVLWVPVGGSAKTTQFKTRGCVVFCRQKCQKGNLG